MIIDALPDIPRWYTAIAEWGACLVYVFVLKRRLGVWATTAVLASGLGLLLLVHWAASMLPIGLWTLGMGFAIAVMFAIIFVCVASPALSIGYLVARALVLAELAASLQWQLHSFVFAGSDPTPATIGLLVGVYALAFVGAGFAEARHFSRAEPLIVGGKEVITAVAIALTTFAVSNLSFLNANTPFSARLGMELFYIRTLVDFAGYIALYMQQEHRRELQLREENIAVHALLRSQHEQYLLTRRSIDALSRMHHDMKNHLIALRGEDDPDRKKAYIDELEESIRGYGDRVETGNRVLDTVLTAKRMVAAENGISLTCVADGTLLNSMSVIDICTIVGNALDNAIESTLRISDSEQRTVRLATFAQDDFVMLRVENSFDGVVHRRDGRLRSRKADPDRHGYGLRNIEAAVEKYGGSVSINVEGTWFSLRALLPR